MSDYNFQYYDRPANRDICSLVENGKKVLDVGCATGKIAENLVKEKGCEVIGIELDEGMAHEAKRFCKEVIVADLETLKSIDYPEGYFDVLLFADILEHTRNPEEILNNLKKYLSSQGYILISIPNTANWEIRLKLLLGNFDYAGGTILDCGHLRFFTLKSIKKLVEDCGFSITGVTTRNAFLKPLGILWKTLFAWGFVIKAEKVISYAKKTKC